MFMLRIEREKGCEAKTRTRGEDGDVLRVSARPAVATVW